MFEARFRKTCAGRFTDDRRRCHHHAIPAMPSVHIFMQHGITGMTMNTDNRDDFNMTSVWDKRIFFIRIPVLMTTYQRGIMR